MYIRQLYVLNCVRHHHNWLKYVPLSRTLMVAGGRLSQQTQYCQYHTWSGFIKMLILWLCMKTNGIFFLSPLLPPTPHPPPPTPHPPPCLQ